MIALPEPALAPVASICATNHVNVVEVCVPITALDNGILLKSPEQIVGDEAVTIGSCLTVTVT